MIKYSFRSIVILLTAALTSGCNDEKLLDNLTQSQANHVVAILQQHNISAHKNGNLKAGYVITVGQSENTAALSIINQYQLPWSADVQIGEAFPSGSLVASPNAEPGRGTFVTGTKTGTITKDHCSGRECSCTFKLSFLQQ